MGSSLSFFAGPEDDKALCGQARSLGLALVTPWLDHMATTSLDEPARGPFWYLSFLPIASLHPYGSPPVQVSDATDPLVELTRGYYSPPFLVAGRIYWSDDVPALAGQTKPYFTRLTRWIRNNWRRRPEDRYYIGPDAERLLTEAGAELRYLPPGVEVEQKVIR